MREAVQLQDIVFVDLEVDGQGKVCDIGAMGARMPLTSLNGNKFRSSNLEQLKDFVKNTPYVCGHNIFKHDLKYIGTLLKDAGVRIAIDTLSWSPLMFPQKPYHKLLKDDKIQIDQLNNPLNDAMKAMELFIDEVSAFEKLTTPMKLIYYTLLEKESQFRGFFYYVKFHDRANHLPTLIRQKFENRICENAEIEELANQYPVELAYCLAAISVEDRESIIPRWVQINYPRIQEVYHALRGKPCESKCSYCREHFDIHKQLKMKFGYEEFRKYAGEPLQEKAVQAAVNGSSLLAIFPTGGGKSLTFQLPALMEAEATSGLTVVISPLQSLMKDQVDHLANNGISDAVTVNGMLNIVERAEAL